MRTQRILAMLALSLLASATAFAECKPRPLDLAGGDTTVQDSALAGQALCFKLVNALPDATYEREIHKEKEVVLPLPLPESDVKTVKEMAESRASVGCQVEEIKSAIKALSEAKKEKNIPGHRITLERLRQDQTEPACVQDINDALGTIGPRSVLGEFVLGSGERLTVTVTRKEEKDDQGNVRWGEKTWKFVFTTGPRGEWSASYGFAFLPERNEEFFAKQQDDVTFVVTRQSESSDVDVEPVVFFTWTSAKRQGKAWTWGPTAGLGIDLSKPTLFAGYSWTYSRNITFITGAGVHQRSRLDGTFEEGQVLEQNLTPDQLEDDEGFGVSGFVGVTLRFGKNPFKGNDSSGDSGK